MKGAAMLDVATYEDVEADSSATGQAAAVVAIVAVCSAIGALDDGGRGIIGGLIGALAGWLLWAGVTYIIGDKLLGGTATWGELLRTLGFAQTPGVFMLFGIIPVIEWVVAPVVFVWTLIAGVIAIRQALDFSTGKAVATALLAWLAVIITFALLGAIGLGLGR
jgi:hypothetical protein